MTEMAAWIKSNWLLLSLLALIAGAFALLHNKPSDVDSLDELSTALTTGQPTVVEFYSNF
jgi:TRAP-type mannitol/chloroaromatic compound transport system permease small subunit